VLFLTVKRQDIPAFDLIWYLIIRDHLLFARE